MGKFSVLKNITSIPKQAELKTKLFNYSFYPKIDKEIEQELNEGGYESLTGNANFIKAAQKYLFSYDLEYLNELLTNDCLFSSLIISRKLALNSTINLIRNYYPSLIFFPKIESNYYRDLLELNYCIYKEYDYYSLENIMNYVKKEIPNGSYIVLPLTEDFNSKFYLDNDIISQLSEVLKDKHITPIFDIPNTGFITGNYISDLKPLKYFNGYPVIIIQDISNSLSINSECVTTLNIISADKYEKEALNSIVKIINRNNYCNPHKYGALFAEKVLSKYFNEYLKEFKANISNN